MNALIETLNTWGGNFLKFAWPIFWQSSLLIILLFVLDVMCRRKLRASIRYALWLVVLVKLCLPPTMASPTSPVWWLFSPKPLIKPVPVLKHYVVSYGDAAPVTDYDFQTIPTPALPPPKLNFQGWILVAAASVSAGLLLWIALRWWKIMRKVRLAIYSDALDSELDEASRLAGLRFSARLKLVDGQMSPAVCGLFRPVILLPQTLADKLSPAQLRAVLLHELFHLRRRDVWVNCVQALFQVIYWWHPLLWLANARIRRLREEAVDDAVMLALREEAETYAPTLLEVAKLAFRRPLMSLGLVGIMESRSALRQRIERLVDFHAPHKAGLTFLSLIGIFVFSAVALPMGEAPEKPVKTQSADHEFSAQALDLIKSGNVTIWNDGNTFLMVKKRETNLLEGIIVITRSASGTETFLTADMGSVKEGSESNSLWLEMNDVRSVSGQVHSSSKELSILLRKFKPASRGQYFGKFFSGEGTNNVPLFTTNLTGILADTNFLMVIHALEQRNGTETLAEPEVTTTSRRGENRISLPSISVPIKTNGVTGQPSLLARTFKIFNPIPEHDLKQALSDAGVTFPPTTMFYTASGVFLVRSTPEQLAAVERVALQLNGGPTNGVNAHSIASNSQIAAVGDVTNQVQPLYARTFKIDPQAFLPALKQASEQLMPNYNYSMDSSKDINTAFRELLSQLGVNLGFPQGKSIFYSDKAGKLFVKATTEDLDMAERIIMALSEPVPQGRKNLHPAQSGNEQPSGIVSAVDINQLITDGKLLYEMGKLNEAKMKLNQALSLSPSNATAQYYIDLIEKTGQTGLVNSTNSISTSDKQKQTLTKLDEIRFHSITYDHVPLAEVLRRLTTNTQRLDPQKVGVNFRCNSDLGGTNMPSIKIASLTEVRLADLLHAIVLVADHPIEYQILPDGSVMFSAKKTSSPKTSPELFIRTFQMDTSKFGEFLADFNLKQLATPTTINVSTPTTHTTISGPIPTLNKTIKEWFSTLGVDESQPAGKTVFYNSRSGVLLVKATKSDLDTIEHALLQFLNTQLPQIHIKACFVEVPKGTMSRLSQMQNVTNLLSSGALIKIFNVENYRAFIDALELRKDVKFLAEPEATTTSGRQTKMRATYVQNIITNFVFEEDHTNTAVVVKTDNIEAGSIFDVVPTVLADGKTLNLRVNASRTEFWGYAQVPTNTVPQTVTNSTGEPITLPIIWPCVESSLAKASINLFDNQTAMLTLDHSGQVIFGKPDAKREKVVADWIRAGKEKNHRDRKETLVFFTATIVDSAGNRVHSDSDLPLAQKEIPPQPSLAIPGYYDVNPILNGQKPRGL